MPRPSSSMALRLEADTRLDPRCRNLIASAGAILSGKDVKSREEVVEKMNSKSAQKGRKMVSAMMDMCDTEDIAPSAGLEEDVRSFVSEPDGNTCKVRVVRPVGAVDLPGVVYYHGGGMMDMSAFDGNYRAWAKIIAAQGVVVCAVEFRNAAVPSFEGAEVAPFPAALNDCCAGVRWAHAHAKELGIDSTRLIVAGDSGGGNLSLATAMKLKGQGLLAGVFAMCPYISGQWPLATLPSSMTNEGYILSLHHNLGRMAYGIEAFERKDPLAWPLFATKEDLAGLCPVTISVNECDPLCDEGVLFYRNCCAAAVHARCRMVMGTFHGSEILPIIAPDITRDTAIAMAGFARHSAASMAPASRL